MTLFRYVVSLLSVASAIVIACRSLAGPLTFPLKVTDPVHPEVWFALSLNVMLLLSSRAGEEVRAAREIPT